MKRISDSYLYHSAGYEKEIFSCLMTADRVDKNSDSFSDVVYDVKRQANAVLIKVLLSDKVVLLLDKKGMSRAFKVIYCKDPKDKKDKKKVFIDCTGLISYENGEYKCLKSMTLISYLMTAMVYIIYNNMPQAIMSNHTVVKSGTEAFVDLMLYVFGYLKVPVTYADNKERMSFVLAEYFQTCVLGKEQNEGTYNLAKSVAGITDKKICDNLHIRFADVITPEITFDKFLAKFAEVFLDQKVGQPTPKNRAVLTIDSFAQRWMYAYGPSTFLGLECFVPFSQILTDTYNGAFINQQNTIEKVVGKNVVTFSNELLKIGMENA